MQKQFPKVTAQKVIVSEAGASVYSASELAAQEFPDLDVSLRGAVSIARRLQDPLAELVKIDPKSIGVGQYQHDVSQTQLARKLDAVVEDCVNAVGVDLNTASVALLTRVAGLTRMMAQNIVSWRDENGQFQNRQQLLKVSRLGPKAFEQCAGFLRINHGDNPLDASTVHPEAYPVVERILAATQQALKDLMGNSSELRNLKAVDFTDDKFGVPTMARFDDIDDNLVIIDSVSKRFSACGARVGCVVTKNLELQNAILKFCQSRLSVATIDQIGAAALYTVDPAFFRQSKAEYRIRRDTVISRLRQIPGVVVEEPMGAFYLMASLPVDDADRFQHWLLECFDDKGDTVMFAPGAPFYETPGKGTNEVRIAYVLKKPDLERAMEVLAKGIAEYQRTVMRVVPEAKR